MKKIEKTVPSTPAWYIIVAQNNRPVTDQPPPQCHPSTKSPPPIIIKIMLYGSFQHPWPGRCSAAAAAPYQPHPAEHSKKHCNKAEPSVDDFYTIGRDLKHHSNKKNWSWALQKCSILLILWMQCWSCTDLLENAHLICTSPLWRPDSPLPLGTLLHEGITLWKRCMCNSRWFWRGYWYEDSVSMYGQWLKPWQTWSFLL